MTLILVLITEVSSIQRSFNTLQNYTETQNGVLIIEASAIQRFVIGSTVFTQTEVLMRRERRPQILPPNLYILPQSQFRQFSQNRNEDRGTKKSALRLSIRNKNSQHSCDVQKQRTGVVVQCGCQANLLLDARSQDRCHPGDEIE